MLIKDECKEQINNKEIVLEEKKSKITFINKKQNEYCKINLECHFKNENIKHCDWLLMNESEKYYIELKGCHIADGAEQLKSAIKKLYPNSENFAFIISSGKFKAKIKMAIWKKQFKKELNSILYIKRSNCNFDLENKKFV